MELLCGNVAGAELIDVAQSIILETFWEIFVQDSCSQLHQA